MSSIWKGPYIIDEQNQKGLRFCDYQFWLSPNGDLVMDPELATDTTDRSLFEVGSKFVLTRTNKGNLAFVKLDKPYTIVPFPPLDTELEWPYGK